MTRPTSETPSRGRTFTTTLLAAGKSATGFEVPAEVITALDHGKRPPVAVQIGGHTFRSTVAVMGGRYMVGVSAENRRLAGVNAGDAITVTLTLVTAPRTVDVPDDFAKALRSAGVRSFFDKLANSLQRYHVDLIASAKTPETRQRRIERAVAAFRDGRSR